MRCSTLSSTSTFALLSWRSVVFVARFWIGRRRGPSRRCDLCVVSPLHGPVAISIPDGVLHVDLRRGSWLLIVGVGMYIFVGVGRDGCHKGLGCDPLRGVFTV